MEKQEKKKGGNLNRLLWICFSAFALIVAALIVVSQNIVSTYRYRRQTKERLKTVLTEVAQTIRESDDTIFVRKTLFDTSRLHGINGYLIYPDGESVFPEMSGTEREPELAARLKKSFDAGIVNVEYSTDGHVSYATRTELLGEECYLCVSRPPEPITKLEDSFWTVSLFTAGLVIVLSFAFSAIVAGIVTKPIMEVTERAKQLANGDYNFPLKSDYFCREINDLSDSIEYARQEISKTDTMQKELIANVSHDFKTPLTMIKAYASMIREISGDDKEKRDAHAQIIIDETDRLASLVGDVLDLSKLKAGFGTDDITVFNLSEEVYRIAGRFEYLKDTQGFQIETEVEDDLYASANRGRIGQVLYNLIGNAVNYTGEDKHVTVRLFRKGENSRFEVIDTGKGIKPEEIETIWDRYYRSSEMHKRPVKGTGLGLSIVKSILQSHKFPFGVQSEEGKGSCFWVEFFPPPAAQEEREDRKK